MKLIAVLSAFFTGAFAQRIAIGSPLDASSINTGDLTVQVLRGNSLTGSTEVAIVISIVPCFDDGSCPDPADRLGSTLYLGPFNPQYPKTHTATGAPEQNFTVSVPSFLADKKALLSVVHLSLVGAGPFPFFEIVNTTVKVAK